MRRAFILILIITSSTAHAHPGHWGELAGHDHWIAGAAVGVAGLAAIWGALKGKKAQTKSDEDVAGKEGDLEEEAA